MREPVNHGKAESGAPDERSRWRRRLGNAVILFAATAIASVLGEVVLRVVYEPPEVSWYPLYSMVKDPFVGARFAPNLRLRVRYGSDRKRHTFTTNSLGFRGREVPERKAPGRYRVLFLGDSFTEGFGLGDDETLPHHFEAIARRMDPRIEVINAGQNGYELREYARFLRGYLRRLQPDLVVLSLHAGNDLAPTNPDEAYHPRDSTSYGMRCAWDEADRIRSSLDRIWVHVRHPDSRLAAVDRWFHRNSVLYRLGTRQLLRLDLLRLWVEDLDWIEEMPVSAPVFIGRLPFHLFLTERHSANARDLEEGRVHLEDIRRVCTSMHVRLFIQIIPCSVTLARFEPVWQLRIDKWRQSMEWELGRPLRPGDIDKTLLNRRASELVARSDIEFIDLTPLVESAVRYDEFYQLDFGAFMGHFSAADNVFDALVLTKALIDHDMLPSTITTDGLRDAWDADYSRVQPPFFPPRAPAVENGAVLVRGFSGGAVASSMDGLTSDPIDYDQQGIFTPVFDVRPDVEAARKGDFIEYRFHPGPTAAGAPLVLAVEICRPATDATLSGAVRQSVMVGDKVLWSRGVSKGPQGFWRPVVVRLPASSRPSTVRIRVEATRDFRLANTGEFPFVLRLRRMSLYRVENARATRRVESPGFDSAPAVLSETRP